MAINILENPGQYPQYADVIERATGGEPIAAMPNYAAAPEVPGAIEASQVPAGLHPIEQDAWKRGSGPVDLRGKGIYMHGSSPHKPQPLPWWMARNDRIRQQQRMAARPAFSPHEARNIFRSGDERMMQALSQSRRYEAELNAKNALAAGVPFDRVMSQYGDAKMKNQMLMEQYKNSMRMAQRMQPPEVVPLPGGGRAYQTGSGWRQVYERQTPAPPKSQYTPSFQLSQAKTILDEKKESLKKAENPLAPDPETAKRLRGEISQLMQRIEQIGPVAAQQQGGPVTIRNKQTGEMSEYDGDLTGMPEDQYEIVR